MMNTRFMIYAKALAFVLVAFAVAAVPSFADLAAVEAEWTPPGGGAGIPMWGFVEVTDANIFDCTTVDPTAAWNIGPQLRATAGDTLTVNVKNCLAEPVSFFVPGLRPTASDGTAGKFTAEVAAGGTATYEFNLTGRAGSFLYHSATDRIRTQVPMGLYGALVVDDAASVDPEKSCAYGDGVTCDVVYDQDAVLVLSEIDPALNADPTNFGGARVINWNPQYFLINGQAFPETTSIAFAADTNVLLRLVNAGLETLVPSLEGGLYMDLIAEDGNRYPHPITQYGVELTAGKTIDAMINVGSEGSYALYDRGLHLTNGAATGGGMLTYLDVSGAAGALQLGAATYSVAETLGGSTLMVTVDRVGGSAGAVTVDYATDDGTATDGADYTAVSGTLNFASGDSTSQSFTIDILDDNVVEVDETFSVILTGANLGTPSSAVVTITDDDAAGTLQLSAASYVVAEDGLSLMVTVERVGGSTGAVSVDYATADDGTATAATAGTDYIAILPTALTFGDGVITQTFPITILPDTDYEGDETFSVSLSNATGATLGTPASAVVTIIEDDPVPPEPGALQLSSAAYSVAENGGTVLITVDRVGGSAGAVSVDYATADGTATTADLDYTAAAGTLNFAAGDAASQSFTIDILDDTDPEVDETFSVTLTGANLGTPAIAVVTIRANVPPVANDDFATTPRNTPVTFSVTSNDGDTDGTIDPTTVDITTGVLSQRGGSVVNNFDGTVTYSPPNPGFRGTDTFQYTVNDDDGATSNVATVRINVVR